MSDRYFDPCYQTFFIEHKHNLCKTWNGIKSIINVSKKSTRPVNCLSINDKEETDPLTIADSFNTFFSTVAQKIENKIIKTDKHFKDYLKNPVHDSFFLRPTDPEEIKKELQKMNSHKAYGPNSIPTNILKNLSVNLSAPLSELINLSFNEGRFPKALKTASVTPVFKKGNSLSLTSNLSKLIEKLVHERLYFFLEMKSVIFV